MASPNIETPYRIEPALLQAPTAAIGDVLAELAFKAARLEASLRHPETAASLASVVRVMNTYYSNLIEGHNTRPRDIERALAGDVDADATRRNLQIEARAHVRVQAWIDELYLRAELPDVADSEFLRELHRRFYEGASDEMLRVTGGGREFLMHPGEWRNQPEQDNAVGRHIPPSSEHIEDFMSAFASRYRFEPLGQSAKIMAVAAAHHRFNYIHPFPDGNGRVSRLMSHAMSHHAGIGAHGLWSISRGLARGLEDRGEYKRMMDYADSPRQNDLDGRGNLSQQALEEFTLWFLKVCLDQITFMSSLFELDTLSRRLRRYVEQNEDKLKPESTALLEEALLRGRFDRGEIMRITGLKERSARNVLSDLIRLGLLGSETPKAPVSLRFPTEALDVLLPRLYVES